MKRRSTPGDPPKRRPKKLTVGKKYVVWWGIKNKMRVKFIQITEKGFNFLNLDTNMCILNRHLYLSKDIDHINSGATWFWINKRLNIE